ncbi:hypothetical protein ACFWAN_29660 [Streptomyces mirabilis]|uniref:hypothetical protein n=1 Tax=Streptomyces mirabilis TaxID=68239 RepID=UPI003646B2B4
MLPDAAVAYAMDWYRTRQHPQQEAAAEQTDLLDAAAHGDDAGAGCGYARASGALEDDAGSVESARAAAGTVSRSRPSATPGAANCPFTRPCRISRDVGVLAQALVFEVLLAGGTLGCRAVARLQLPEPVVDFDLAGFSLDGSDVVVAAADVGPLDIGQDRAFGRGAGWGPGRGRGRG